MNKCTCKKDKAGKSSWILLNETGQFGKLVINPNSTGTVTSTDDEFISLEITESDVFSLLHNKRETRKYVEAIERRLRGKRWEITIPYIRN